MIVIKHRTLRRVIRVAVPAVCIPALAVLGSAAVHGGRHLLFSFAVALLSVLLFLAGFERKTTGARRLVLAAVMIALCVVGRFIPFVSPVTALTVLAALYLGGETGFLIGALSAVLSNFYFGQGPWTPFQMLAWGLIGLVAGLLSAPLRRSRALLLCYGVLAGVLYSLVMDVWTVLWYADGFDLRLYLAAIATAAPYTAVYAASNFAFLWFLARPIGEKLRRVKVKYGV